LRVTLATEPPEGLVGMEAPRTAAVEEVGAAAAAGWVDSPTLVLPALGTSPPPAAAIRAMAEMEAMVATDEVRVAADMADPAARAR
jgi:hypothetical protein